MLEVLFNSMKYSSQAILIVLLVFLLEASKAYADNSILITESEQQLGNAIEIFHDSHLQVNKSSVLNQLFIKNDSVRVKFFDTEGQYWIKFRLENPGDHEIKRLISLNYAHIKKFELYEVNDEQLFKTGSVNSETSLSERRVFSRFPVLDLSVNAKSEQVFILNMHLLHFPVDQELKLFPANDFYDDQLDALIFISIFSGFLLALIVYNLSLYISLLTPQYLYFSSLALLAVFIVLGYDGLLYLLPWAPSVELVSFVIQRSSVIAIFLWIAYLKDILEFQASYPRLNKAAETAKIVIIVIFLVSLISESVTFITDVLFLPVQFLSLYLMFDLYRKGSKAALYIGISILLSMFGIGIEVWVLSPQEGALDLAQHDDDLIIWLRQYLLYISIMASMFFMSWALAVFVRQVRDEKEHAQQESLDLLIESNKLKDNYANQLEYDIEKATEELRHKANLLQQLDKQKSRFFTNISHEFRTPLTLIKGPIMGLMGKEYGELNDRGKVATDICSRNIDRLSRLIDELLILAEVESGSSKLKVSISDVNQFCRRTASLFTHTAVEKDIRFIQNIPLTQSPLYFDAPKLEKILCNLLSNAFKYTPQGGEVIFSVASTKNEEKSTGSFVDIKVEDSGPGISESEQVQVFDRFFRSTQTDESAIEGSGIGLSLVKDLVNLHGGDVSVHPRSDTQGVTGSCFTVNLPLGKAHLHEDEIQVQHSIITTESPVLLSNNNQSVDDHAKTLLVVEDNSDMRTFAVSLLDQDYRIIEAVHGKQALERLAEHHVDLVISDIMMPEMDGIRLLENIRNNEKWQALPVILLTARASDEDRIQALRARADEYLAKPFNAEELKLKVANLLRRTSIQAPSDKESNFLPPKPPAAEGYTSKFLNKARESVLSHISNSDFDVLSLADALHMSRSTLQRRIVNEASVTAAQFIRQIRLEQAHQFMVNKSYRTVAETAYAVGFSHPGYFSKMYKKYTDQLDQRKI